MVWNFRSIKINENELDTSKQLENNESYLKITSDVLLKPDLTPKDKLESDKPRKKFKRKNRYTQDISEVSNIYFLS